MLVLNALPLNSKKVSVNSYQLQYYVGVIDNIDDDFEGFMRKMWSDEFLHKDIFVFEEGDEFLQKDLHTLFSLM